MQPKTSINGCDPHSISTDAVRFETRQISLCHFCFVCCILIQCLEKSVPVGAALLPNVCNTLNAKCLSLTPPKKAKLKAPLSPLQTAWTGFDPNLYSQSPQACKPVCRAPTWLTTASVEWKALLTILAPGVWQTLCQSQCPC